MLVDQLFSIRDVAPSGCQPAYLIIEVLFLAMLQVITPLFAGISFRHCAVTSRYFSVSAANTTTLRVVNAVSFSVLVEQGTPLPIPLADYEVDLPILLIIQKWSVQSD